MSRWVVTSAFVLFALAVGMAAVEAWQNALAQPAVKSFAVAAYSLLKLGVGVCFAVFVLVREPSRRPSRDPVAFVACATAVLAVVTLQRPDESASTSLVVAGDLVIVLSSAWLLASVLTLGRCFGVLPEARGLVTRGPYGLVRHPVYLGEFGAFFGLVLAAPTRWNAVVSVALVAAQAVRMRLEERALTAEFPEYAEYAARTPRLLPRIALRWPEPAVGGDRA